MSYGGPNNEIKQNELFDLQQKGWLEVGAGADAGKWRLSAKGLEQYNRLVTEMAAKNQVLVNLKVLANAYQTEAAIKGFMQQ